MKNHDWIISECMNLYHNYSGHKLLYFLCKDCKTIEFVSGTNEEAKKLLLEATNCDAIMRQKVVRRLLGQTK